jgi:hypothetical protein
MHEIWIVAGAAVAVAAVAVPFAAIIIVSIASRREEAAQSFSRSAPGAAARAARRLLDFRNQRSARRSGLAPSAARLPLREVRFEHARRTLPDASQFAAGGQSQPRSIRLDDRQGAGV